MRISNPTITESSYFSGLTDPSQKLFAVLIDLSRHMYSLDYARTSSVANIFNDIRSLLDHIDDEMDEYVEPELDKILEQVAKPNRGAYDTEKCRELANELLQYIVVAANMVTPEIPDSDDDSEWEEDEDPRNKNPDAHHAVEGDNSSEILRKKELPKDGLAVLWKTIGGKPYRVSVLDKKNKVIARELFFDKKDAEVFFEALA